ncbi:MAG: thermonuclease family protein, partial [bacterium]
MKRVVIILTILLLLAKESTASLSDFLNSGSATQISGTVTSIIDGDTIKVEMSGTETKVRLLSIDTPELMNEPFAQTAKDFASQTLLSQPIQLFYSKNPTQQWDDYGRLLAVVVKDDEIFNLKLLEQGLAVRMFIFNDIIKFPAWED